MAQRLRFFERENLFDVEKPFSTPLLNLVFCVQRFTTLSSFTITAVRCNCLCSHQHNDDGLMINKTQSEMNPISHLIHHTCYNVPCHDSWENCIRPQRLSVIGLPSVVCRQRISRWNLYCSCKNLIIVIESLTNIFRPTNSMIRSENEFYLRKIFSFTRRQTEFFWNHFPIHFM